MRIEEANEAIIGKTYDVPHVIWVGNVNGSGKPHWVPGSLLLPILGPMHEDRELIGFPDDHWHIDWRFMPESSWKSIACWNIHRDVDTAAAARVLSEQNTSRTIVRRRRKCIRPHITFPSIGKWHKKLEAAYSEHVMKCLVCPHRGISLVGAPVINGALVCPGHGLAWDKETGIMTPR